MRNKTNPANDVVIKGARPCATVGRERNRGAHEKLSVVTAGAAMNQRCRQGGSLTLLLLRLCLQERHGQEVRRNKELREEVTA